MSQRGRLREGAKDITPANRWAYIPRVLVFAFALTLGTTLTVIAQDTQILTSKVVTVLVDGTVRQVTTTKDTVQTLLHQEGIGLNDLDRCEPQGNTPVVNGMTIAITRVRCEHFTRHVEIPAPVVTHYDSRLSREQTFELRSGRAGVARETVVVWKRDGAVSAQWVEGTKVLRHSRAKVILRGTSTRKSRGGIRRVIEVVATAYDPGPGSCGPHCTGRTAMGIQATKGVIAVDPRVIPLGTRVFVDGYGTAIAADVGSAIKGHRIDVCFSSRREALRWGRRHVQVMVLE